MPSSTDKEKWGYEGYKSGVENKAIEDNTKSYDSGVYLTMKDSETEEAKKKMN